MPKLMPLSVVIIEIAQHYNLTRRAFLAAFRSKKHIIILRLEQKVLDFSKAFQINIDSKIAIEDLTAVLN
jgi:hypothetical protein